MARGIWSWDVRADKTVQRLADSPIDYEAELEAWIKHDPSIVGVDWLPICIRPKTEHGTIPDFLGIDIEGNTVVVELKRDKTPREAVAQVLEYTAWVADQSYDDIIALATSGERALFQSKEKLLEGFATKFGLDFPEFLNEQQRVLLVATEITDAVAKLVEYLAETYHVPINVVQLSLSAVGDRRILSRTAILSEEEVAQRVPSSKRQQITTWEDVLRLAIANGVESIARTLYGLRNSSPFVQTQFSSNGFSLGVSTKEGTRVLFSVAVTERSKPNVAVFRIVLENLALISGRSEAECRIFLEQMKVGTLETGTPKQVRRSCASEAEAKQIAEALLAFAYHREQPAAPALLGAGPAAEKPPAT